MSLSPQGPRPLESEAGGSVGREEAGVERHFSLDIVISVPSAVLRSR